ncbi:MAG: LysM peptidoglycan-binding domain-containing protein, partial [Firmicutes bacterium]|nr:LysM peptidoglycan-binding domain-containing protein [Bacillota bacterium]
MSALAKAITVVLIFGLVCCGFAGSLFAVAQEDNEAPGIPLYYLQLRDFTASLEERAHRPKIMEYTVQPGDCLYTIAR